MNEIEFNESFISFPGKQKEREREGGESDASFCVTLSNWGYYTLFGCSRLSSWYERVLLARDQLVLGVVCQGNQLEPTIATGNVQFIVLRQLYGGTLCGVQL